ncbi:hypothetical protein PGH47_26920 [Streptomyces sp. HUAS 31]|uniref:hypothetical protein n=1 Tax=Streptomyces sp. HUAS 31 TaxID=3020055 RepID=UPI00230555EE|nr:hypothetical protein [Streptomyces sp. HUAS 31]WCD99096.1 hypothetical protein PGH47_26920 [Streptomyces sp. HUAS 31]
MLTCPQRLADEPWPYCAAPADDYPSRHDLPEDVRDTWEPRFRTPSGGGVMRPSDSDGIATKAGGRPARIQPADWPDCAGGHRMGTC